MPVMRLRVVCGFGDTMATFWPSRRLSSVDFPTLGRPARAMKPARCSDDDVEARGGTLIKAPEEGHLARVPQPGLPGGPGRPPDQAKAGGAAPEGQCLP